MRSRVYIETIIIYLKIKLDKWLLKFEILFTVATNTFTNIDTKLD